MQRHWTDFVFVWTRVLFLFNFWFLGHGTCAKVKWMDTSPVQPKLLSVCDGLVLVTPRPPASQLTQYSEDGQVLRQVPLPGNMTPHHAAMTPRGTFIVCCTMTSDSKDLQKVTYSTLIAYISFIVRYKLLYCIVLYCVIKISMYLEGRWYFRTDGGAIAYSAL